MLRGESNHSMLTRDPYGMGIEPNMSHQAIAITVIPNAKHQFLKNNHLTTIFIIYWFDIFATKLYSKKRIKKLLLYHHLPDIPFYNLLILVLLELKGVLMLWVKFMNWLEQFGSWLLVGVFIAALVVLIGLIIWKVQERITAVVLTTLTCILCFIPLISSINILVESKIKGTAISEKKAELKAIELQVENEIIKKQNLELQNESLYKDIQIKNLDDEIDLLKNTQLSMNNLNRICEMALLETQLKQTDVRKHVLDSEKGIIADRVENEILVVTTHDINAKFGVDLKQVLVREGKDNQLIISGIKSKYIGSDRNISDVKISEIREIKYKNDLISNKSVLYDKANIQRANNYAQLYETEYQKRLSDGLESNFLDEAVVKLSQNFISVILAPLKKEISFENNSTEEGVPIFDYLNSEIEAKQKEKIRIQEERNN